MRLNHTIRSPLNTVLLTNYPINLLERGVTTSRKALKGIESSNKSALLTDPRLLTIQPMKVTKIVNVTSYK
ncbi:hypothetical protein TrRE_jg5228, partial [Triparma retinervis]